MIGPISEKSYPTKSRSYGTHWNEVQPRTQLHSYAWLLRMKCTWLRFHGINFLNLICRKLENILASVRLASRRTWTERWQYRRDDKSEIERLTKEIMRCSESFMVCNRLNRFSMCTQHCLRLRWAFVLTKQYNTSRIPLTY
jgi:hypothetical protein